MSVGSISIRVLGFADNVFVVLKTLILAPRHTSSYVSRSSTIERTRDSDDVDQAIGHCAFDVASYDGRRTVP